MSKFQRYVSKLCMITDLQTYVEKEVHALREHFVFAWIKSYEKKLGRIGDQGAEANHSSIVARLSAGG